MANEVSGKEIAKSLREAADRFEQSDARFSAHDFELLKYCWDRDEFLRMVRTYKSLTPHLTKNYTDDEINVIADFGILRMRIYANRDRVCRVIKPAQPAEYECDPLLSPDEDAELVNG